MTEGEPESALHSKRRLELAREQLGRWIGDPGLKAVIVTGSVARAKADDASDVDVIIITSPSVEEFERAAENAVASGGGIHWGSPETATSGFAVYEYIDGIKFDFAYQTIERSESIFIDVLEAKDTDLVKQTVVSGILESVVLHDTGWLEPWRTRLRIYPSALGRAMIMAHLRFQPAWVLKRMVADRGEELMFFEITLQTIQNMIAILCGLNHRYHPGKLKGIERILPQLDFKPRAVVPRFKALFRLEIEEAVGELIVLVEEIFDLIDEHMPSLETTSARASFARTLRH